MVGCKAISALLAIPFLRLAGGAVLLWIAYKLVQPEGGVVTHAPVAFVTCG